MRTIVLFFAALVLTSAGIVPMTASPASAAQIKGRQILNSKPFSDTTGNCSCNWLWYTIGAKPGTLKVTVALTGSFSHELAPTYAIRVYLFKGSHLVKFGQAGCRATDTHCHSTVQETLHVSRQSVYYMEIEGPGADGIVFTARVVGHMYRVQ